MSITTDQFLSAHSQILDPEKSGVISALPSEALFVVAGPGTGKTACLALRVLKLIYVDQMDPKGIIATTFTRKAAAELRSRILGWGFSIRENLLANTSIQGKDRQWVEKVDINQIFCGTIDSLCDKLLSEFRPAGEEVFAIVDSYVDSTMLIRESFLFNSGNRTDSDIDSTLKALAGYEKQETYGWNLTTKTKALSSFAERLVNDEVDKKDLSKKGRSDFRKGYKKSISLIEDHQDRLRDKGFLGYGGMALEVLNRLKAKKLTIFTDVVTAVLVDEYQDTNLLQEDIYFELAKAANGALTVVGDDDQSMYRFRGATVELFSEFPLRFQKKFKKTAQQHFLRTNYRSTQNIVSFVNKYATIDSSFQKVRVKGKPPLVSGSSVVGSPILGMFRDSPSDLASDLAEFIRKVTFGHGYDIGNSERITLGSNGAVGDIAMLTFSPKEQSGDKAKFPLLLKNELARGSNSIEVFNPRGQVLGSVPKIEMILGLMLLCIDDDGTVEGTLNTSREAGTRLLDVRDKATLALKETLSSTAKEFVSRWAGRSGKWPRNASLLELVYALANLIPGNPMDDPEFQVHLEAVTRQIEVLSVVGVYGGQIRYDRENGIPSKYEVGSIKEVIRDAIIPILTGQTEVEEDLLPEFPRNRLPILSIHQSKGLEFPLTIVDIGSDFKTDNGKQRFKRFPEKPGSPQIMEDELRPFSPLGAPTRSALDRSFDDLLRMYFVAFSRPESVLLLVGTKKSSPFGSIKNIAAGYDRRGNSHLSSRTLLREI